MEMETKINELHAGMRGINVKGKIESLKEPRTVNLRNGDTAQVADAVLSDESGSIKLSLWNDQISMVTEGDEVAIENGYTQSFRRINSHNNECYGTLKN